MATEFLSYDPAVDGLTNSLLTAWGNCRELARLILRGWVRRGTGMGMTYGGITHWLLQHVYEDHRKGTLKLSNGTLSAEYVKRYLARVEELWKAENPLADEATLQHYELTMLLNEHLMPLYFQHWKQRDFQETRWVGVESEFKVPFEVTRNGLTYRTFLRGKRDGVFVPKGRKRSWLFETKTKTRIDEGTLVDILPFESQVNLYMVAMWLESGQQPEGVRYNIIRRPGLRQKKNESLPQFAKRLTDDVRLRPNWYFLRQNMRVDPKELDRYLGELEDRVWDFMHWWNGGGGHWRNSAYCENKYGTCGMLSLCSKRDTSGLYVRDRLFSELSEDV